MVDGAMTFTFRIDAGSNFEVGWGNPAIGPDTQADSQFPKLGVFLSAYGWLRDLVNGSDLVPPRRLDLFEFLVWGTESDLSFMRCKHSDLCPLWSCVHGLTISLRYSVGTGNDGWVRARVRNCEYWQEVASGLPNDLVPVVLMRNVLDEVSLVDDVD